MFQDFDVQLPLLDTLDIFYLGGLLLDPNVTCLQVFVPDLELMLIPTSGVSPLYFSVTILDFFVNLFTEES